jgi:hypothetical protein
MPSTVIRTFHYDPDDRRLVIEFQTGFRYAYFHVPREVYEEMCSAPSRGAYFNSRVRDRYSYSRIETADC